MTGVNAISIYDSSGNVYQFEGGKIEASGDVYSKTPIVLGNGKVKHHDYALTFKHCDHEVHNTLQRDTNLKALNWRGSVVFFDGYLVWDVDSYIEVEEISSSNPESLVYPYQVKLYKRSSSPKIGQGKNLVKAWQNALYSELFTDSDTNNIADGFTNSTFTSLSFSGGNQSVAYNSGTDSFYIDVTFPVTGLLVVGGFDFSVADTDGAVYVASLNSSSSVINSDTTSLSGTGRETSTITTGAATYYIRLEVRATAAASLTFTDPSLRRNGEFVNA